MRKSLFAYGSLSEGMVHYSKVAEFIKLSEPAWARGEIYRLEVGFPVFLSQGEQKIAGSLVEMEAPETLWHLLDEFHGFDPSDGEKSLFVRQRIFVERPSGDVQASEVYALNPRKLPKSATRIENGDWKQSLATSPALTSVLSDRQKTYIKRLGSSVGREIVPIDLGLYRELMNLSLIVDKGRRLALSRLGQEVFRFLS